MLTLKEVFREDIVKEVTKEFLDTVKERNPELAESLQDCAEIFVTDPEISAKFANMISAKTALLALSPLDGRYSNVSDQLREYFSEFALIKYRIQIEILWLEYLLDDDILEDQSMKTRISMFKENYEYINEIYENFNVDEALRVKEIEKVTNHDVKAVEYYIGEKLRERGLDDLVSLVHIGCTSEDINNLAYATMIQRAKLDVLIPAINELINTISNLSTKFKDVPMMARTHGQPATPTTLGKEFKVYERRLKEKSVLIENAFDRGKFNGATGNYSAISVAFPTVNWPEKMKTFVYWLDLDFNPITTQVESHDDLSTFLRDLEHFNMIVLNLDIDMWMYISIEYFKQKVVQGEVGSSTMPHKVNPIKFENSEGNVYMANGIMSSIIDKLLRSRWQRDLSDSTVQRNVGIAFGYTLQAIKETINGLKRCEANFEAISADLDDNWEVLAEPIQTMLRKYGISDAYEKLKELTRGKKITKEDIYAFVNSLDVLSEEDKATLLGLTPGTYIGYAEKIAEFTGDDIHY
mgnify:CR=1 FL=1